MIDYLSKRFIKNYQNYTDSKVRGHYGILCSILSIVLNLMMAGFKIMLGLITNSIAIIADGFNNLSDVASNIASLIGFAMALKNPDKEHPFGHGRMEYLASLLIAVLILFVGLQTIWDAIDHIINPEPVFFTMIAVVVLLISIVIKYIMGRFNFVIGKRIQSSTLIAAGRDSKVDILATAVTLIALITSLYTDLPVDGILGVFVSIIILKTGYEIGKETVSSLLGAPPDEYLLHELKEFVSNYEKILATHDYMIHDYGHGKRYLTLHVEVDKNEEMMTIHEVIDHIERNIYDKFKIKATIHVDPIDLDDILTRDLKKLLVIIITAINPNYSMHDFRIRKTADRLLLIFDVLIPADDATPHAELIARINDLIKSHNCDYDTLIEIDHSYT